MMLLEYAVHRADEAGEPPAIPVGRLWSSRAEAATNSSALSWSVARHREDSPTSRGSIEIVLSPLSVSVVMASAWPLSWPVYWPVSPTSGSANKNHSK